MRRAIIVTLAVLGLFAAAGIPNLNTAMQRAKQKGTSARLRDWAAELEAYDDLVYADGAFLQYPEGI